ncbi:probable inactive leucine-rich repeat receptor-like protein kinase At3g03770 [Rutidosis leptorrhynchoides]|uniref:probable inactive leucine-rich repeat receptor-like protein kinase At3g03770 n=1 Tax=Rutidosis leptorrhynchoides TaxID=125765 RepID=UPI003A98F0B4
MSRTTYYWLTPVVLLAILFVPILCSNQYNASQDQTLLSIQNLLYYPVVLSSWNNATDFCNTVQSSSVTIVCYEDIVTQLHIINSDKAPPLPKDFSIDTFFTTLVNLPSLKVLTLVSLGLWGQLPATISRFSSLEILNITSNHFAGAIPPEITYLTDLQSLVLDDNNFTGRVPARVGFLTRLSVLSLKNNSLNGRLPESLGRLVDLRVLMLSRNNFTGQVPDLRSLTNLQVLDLPDNSFGPEFPMVTERIISIVLRNNKFTNSLPEELHSFYQLRRLDIALNRFVGSFPSSILSLPSITHLDIKRNRFTGMLLEDLSCNPELRFVDLSDNLLTGRLPSCLASSNARNGVYDGNCFTSNNPNNAKNQKPISFCRTEALAVGPIPRHQKTGKGSKAALAFGIIGGAVLLGVIILIFAKFYAKKTLKTPMTRVIAEKATASYTSKWLSEARYVTRVMKLGTLGVPPYRTFSLEELEEATNSFDTSTFMGEGSHGQMNKGRLKDGSYVVIQCIKMKRHHSTQMFTHHIELISKLRHQHLVSALGHCFEFYLDDSSVSRLFFVYEYVPKGTLRDSISGMNNGKTFPWSLRIAAAIGIAKGIQFLHTGIVPAVFLNNLKITDVLLDQNFVAKISCYKLPLLDQNIEKDGIQSYFNRSKEPNRARDSKPEKDDVYDFGVILLEMILGKQLCKQKEVESIIQQFQTRITADDTSINDIVDPAIRNECSDQSLTTMAQICSRCLVNDPAERPSVDDMLWNLQYAAQVQCAWQNSDGSPDSALRTELAQQ